MEITAAACSACIMLRHPRQRLSCACSNSSFRQCRTHALLSRWLDSVINSKAPKDTVDAVKILCLTYSSSTKALTFRDAGTLEFLGVTGALKFSKS